MERLSGPLPPLVAQPRPASAPAFGFLFTDEAPFEPPRPEVLHEQARQMRLNWLPMPLKLCVAVGYATMAHWNHTRLVDKAPDLTHLLRVAADVLTYGGSWEETTAAVLHDVLEDTSASVEELENLFGRNIARLVLECSRPSYLAERQPEVLEKFSWKARKQAYLTWVEHDASPSALLITACDKLDYFNRMRLDYRDHGEGLWQNFQGDPSDRLWFYKSYVEMLDRRIGKLQHDPSLSASRKRQFKRLQAHTHDAFEYFRSVVVPAKARRHAGL